MSKNQQQLKQQDHKKRLVRNVSAPLPKVSVKSSTTVRVSSSSSKNSKEKMKSEVNNENGVVKKAEAPNFGEPKIQTVAKLTKQIEKLENLKLTTKAAKSKENLALTDKVAKKLNFPYNQAIYKDLMPLCTRTCEQQSSSSSSNLVIREPLPPKDVEPKLNDFLSKKKHNVEYTYSREIPKQQETSIKDINLLKLTEIISTWS